MAKQTDILYPLIAIGGLMLLFTSRTDNSNPSNNSGNTVPVDPSVPLTPTDFLKRYWSQAQSSQAATTIPALFTITQGGLESGWGNHAPGYNFFGIKASSAWKGATQLLDTTEVINGQTVKVKALFRAYPNAKESFIDHGRFFIDNSRYKTALKYTSDPVAFAREVAAAGYATDPNYFDKLDTSMRLVMKLLVSNKLV